MSGATQMKETLEQISVQKSGVDEAKGAALGNMSSAVTDIRAAVERNKADLKPLVEELKRLREEAAKIEPEYQELKDKYAAVAKQYELRSADALKEARALRREAAAAEGAFHELAARGAVVDEQIRRVVGGGASARQQVEALQREVELKARAEREVERGGAARPPADACALTGGAASRPAPSLTGRPLSCGPFACVLCQEKMVDSLKRKQINLKQAAGGTKCARPPPALLPLSSAPARRTQATPFRRSCDAACPLPFFGLQSEQAAGGTAPGPREAPGGEAAGACRCRGHPRSRPPLSRESNRGMAVELEEAGMRHHAAD